MQDLPKCIHCLNGLHVCNRTCLHYAFCCLVFFPSVETYGRFRRYVTIVSEISTTEWKDRQVSKDSIEQF